MKLRLVLASLCASAATASAGGLFLPGAGAVSTSRAGASTAASDDGEALALNPAGLASSTGTFVQLSVVAIDYIMQFTRAGTYDVVDDPPGESEPYSGQPYPTVKNTAKPPLGIGSFQPVPVVAVVTDLGGRVPGLHVAVGLYAPNAYPFRNMSNVDGVSWSFSQTDFNRTTPPPPTRYDIINQQAAVLLPSLAIAYRIAPQIDVGVRLSAGFASLKSTVALWGIPLNYEEYVKKDGVITLDATSSVFPSAGAGATFHVTPAFDIAANYTSEIDIHGKGTAVSTNGPDVNLAGAQVLIEPVPDSAARCAPGGTTTALKGCVDLTLPMSAQLGGRYKLLGPDGQLKGDIELDLEWQNWGAASDYRVVVDGQVATVNNPESGIPLKDSIIPHGFQDTYGVRLGGSYLLGDVVVRGGVAYDTAAAKPGWERVDLDGAARTTIAAGASYNVGKQFKLDAGFGVVLEGTRTQNRNCNPTAAMPGCNGTGMDAPISQREGPDPISPIVDSTSQAENPVNQGTMKSYYLMIMLGGTYHF